MKGIGAQWWIFTVAFTVACLFFCGCDSNKAAHDNCYTPCQKGLTLEDGTYVPCSDEGLIAGCYGNTVCRNRWCVASGKKADRGRQARAGDPPEEDASEGQESADGRCIDDCGCADFGICDSGKCATQCEVDSECNGGETCHHKVCRKECTAGEGDSFTGGCPADTICEIGPDGVTGHCMPNCAPPVNEELFDCLHSVPDGLPPFALKGEDLVENTLHFDEDNEEATFILVNNTSCTLDFAVHRKTHSVFTDEGLEIEDENPLFWLTLSSESGSAEGSAELLVEGVAGGGAEVLITVEDVTNETLPNWRGELTVGTAAAGADEALGATTVSLSYTSGADGNWSGTMYYFGTFGTDKLDEWVDSDFDEDVLENVSNALVKRWGVMRRGDIALDNFLAALSSTVSGSWAYPSMKARCPLATGACYPFANPLENPDDGFEAFSDDLTTSPIPSGVVELPVSMNIQGGAPDATEFSGRFVSAGTLHYAGEPAISISLEVSANTCLDAGLVCKNRITTMASDVVVGGRYSPSANGGSCQAQGDFPEGFALVATPWLLYDFMGDSTVMNGLRLSNQCRDTMQPFDEDAGLLPEGANPLNVNANYAGSNPLPDGRVMHRTLSVVDGAVFNKNLMIILFAENFVVNLSGIEEDFSGYGVMLLRRSPTVLEESDFVGSDQSDNRVRPEGVLKVSCDEELVGDILGAHLGDDYTGGGIDAYPETVDHVVEALLGSAAPVLANEIPHNDIYYLCWETGQFVGGHVTDAEVCKDESKVTYFYFEDGERPSPSDGEWECGDGVAYKQVTFDLYDATTATWKSVTKREVSKRANCEQVLQEWKAEGIVHVDPLRKEGDSEGCTCADTDRRKGWIFERGSDETPGLAPIRGEIFDAFRYKLAFRSRAGKNIGFAPEICGDAPGSVPYCYDPPTMEAIRDRVDCAIALQSDYADEMSQKSLDTLNGYLVENFRSQCMWEGDPELTEEMCKRPIYREDGFEALQSELLIMLGDDNYVSAFASRFDLAGTSGADFQGGLFEDGGINLSGPAGFEMHSLYKATQYYQLALDRFYELMPAIYKVINEEGPTGYITAGSVTSYFDRLIRASTQKARAWSEVSKRYQNFNRPDLARQVIERAYTATYLESVLITRLMDKVTRVSTAADTAQIESIVARAQRQYKSSLLGLRDVNDAITNEINYFGFSPEYIAFPVLDEGDLAEGNTTSFEKLRDLTNEKVALAADKEMAAIEGSTDFDVDAAEFQAELASIRHTYENDLAEICGTFQAADGFIYPAIKTYADKDEKLRLLPEPCGFVDNGEIYQSLGAAHLATLNVQKTLQRHSGKLQEMQNEIDHANRVCDQQYVLLGVISGFNLLIGIAELAVNGIDLSVAVAEATEETSTKIAANVKCSVGTSTSCPMAAVATGVTTTAGGIKIGHLVGAGIAKMLLQAGIAALEGAKEGAEIIHECELAKIGLNLTIANLYIELMEIEIEILEAVEELDLALAHYNGLRHKAERLYVEYDDVLQSAIDVAAAMNNPNTRIYKNDAIINADKAFHDALREAYKTTRVYEYFTSTCYTHLNDLFLVRMVTAGDYNLENYMTELDNAYYAFEETYGAPETHLAILSFKDDILRIPRTSAANPGTALSQSERAALFTEALTDPSRLDDNGYIRVPFSTRLDLVSPLTRNHKISYIEAEIVGENLGDRIGRIYLTQTGTGTVRALDGTKLYYAFPPRLAVVDTFFNGEKEIDGATWWGDVYQNRRFFDLPLANTEWEFVFNGMDELVNEDIELSSVTDINIYIYYTDHTMLLEQ